MHYFIFVIIACLSFSSAAQTRDESGDEVRIWLAKENRNNAQSHQTYRDLYPTGPFSALVQFCRMKLNATSMILLAEAPKSSLGTSSADKNCPPVYWETPTVSYTWTGGCVNGVASGFGIQTYEWGEVFEGTLVDGKRYRKGESIPVTHGNKYVDAYKNGMHHGKGVHTWTNGNKYEGEYKSGIRHGEGVFTWANGNRYEGEFLSGKRHGDGVFTWSNGGKYEGEFQNGKKHGNGVLSYVSGNKYEGEFRNGKRHGSGVFIWASGSRYEGEYERGMPHGYGKMTFRNGGVYKGEYENGLPNGEGIYQPKFGDQYEGFWNDGCLENDYVGTVALHTTRDKCGF